MSWADTTIDRYPGMLRVYDRAIAYKLDEDQAIARPPVHLDKTFWNSGLRSRIMAELGRLGTAKALLATMKGTP